MVDTNVVVVGAGPVGLISASALAQAGVQVTVLEAKPATAPRQHDMIYHWKTLPGLHRLGLLDDMRETGLIGQLWTLVVPSSGEHITIDLSGLADHVEYPYNVHLPREQLTDVVSRRLARYPHASVAWNTRVTGLAHDPDGVTLTAAGRDGAHEIRARWVIGTDGAHSIVRRSLGLGFPGITWPHRFVSTTTGFDWTSVGFTESTHRIDAAHPALVGRIDDTLWRFVYTETRTLPAETIAERMPNAFDAVLPHGADAQLCGWSAYRVHERVADQFRVGRVLLAGDAAHLTSPTSSLGLAGGLFDAFLLAEALAAVSNGQSAHMLDQYAQKRRRVFIETTSPMSSRSMHLLLSGDDPRELETDLAPYRRAAADPRELLEMFDELGELETPSLV
jgi:3-(3-hydroxy-phenyl)propionate hydroxylase